MGGTWVSSAVSPRVRAARLLFISCIVAGLIQKPLIKFAWDVKAFQMQIRRVHSKIRLRSGGAALLGGTAILLRQIFAAKGQRVIGSLAVSLAMAGHVWDEASLAQLHDALVDMEPRDTKKLKGFMVMHGGPTWISTPLKVPENLARFRRASQLLGDFFTSKVAEASAFHDLCSALKSPAVKMHNVGLYSVPHLVRACSVARTCLRGNGAAHIAEPDCKAWEQHLRDMHSISTKRIFDMLAIHSYEDAVALQSTVRTMAMHVWSTSIASRYSAVSLLDLPCQACEFNGVLSAIKSLHCCGDVAAIRFL